MSQQKRKRWWPQTSIEIAAVGLFLLVAISNLIIIQFAKGYFEFYDIPFALVNFSPQMYDYVRIAAPSFILTVVVMLIAYGLFTLGSYLGDLLGRKTIPDTKIDEVLLSKKQKHWLILIIKFLDILPGAILIGVLLWTAWVLIIQVSPKVGYTGAMTIQSYTSISPPEDKLQKVIVYRNGEGVILKIYNTETQRFEDGYEFLPSTQYSARTIRI